MTMNIIFMYILPLVGIVLIFCIPIMARMAKFRASELAEEAEIIDRFYDNAARFIKLTPEARFSELHVIVRWIAGEMRSGPKLIRLVVFSNGRKHKNLPNKMGKAVEDLPDDARHAFAKLMAYSLLVSSFQSPIRGRFYRNALYWLINDQDEEVKEPVQVVQRFARAGRPANNKRQAA